MNERRKHQLLAEGLNVDLIEKTADLILFDMQKTGVSLQEANIVLKRAACALSEAERHRPETPLKDIPLHID